MIAIFLCGPPGCGKSTYIKEHLSHYIVLSKDDIIFREAARLGKHYNDIFIDYVATAHEILIAQIKGCVQNNIDFVLDMTNATEDSRKQKLQHIPDHHIKVGLYFPAYTPEVLSKRIAKRVEQGGQSVPEESIQRFHIAYTLPQKHEGFNLVASSSHFLDIMKIMEFK